MKRQQGGMILLITLIMLFAMTVLAVSTVRSHITATRISTNYQNASINFQNSAGNASTITMNTLQGLYAAKNFINNTAGLYLLSSANAPLWSNINWNSGAVLQGSSGSSAYPASFFIEQLPSVVRPGQNLNRIIQIYRITVRTSNTNNQAASIVQTTVEVPQ